MEHREIRNLVRQTVVEMAIMLGIGDTEVSYTQGSARFGSFFRDMVHRGKLKPCRVGQGRNGTHWYSVRDIVNLKAEEESKAKLL